jgi:serine/threonine protein kinase
VSSVAKVMNNLDEESTSERSESKSLYILNEEDKEVTLEDFKIIKKIGKGGFGVIYLVEKIKDETIYAMKQLRKDIIINKHAVICAKLEKEILKLAKHQFLIGMKYVF